MTIIIPNFHASSDSSNETLVEYVKHLAHCLHVMIADLQKPLFEMNTEISGSLEVKKAPKYWECEELI